MSSEKKITKIGVFYDGNFFLHISNYYNYVHDRQARISISGLHEFIRSQAAFLEETDIPLCQIVTAHYFRGRLNARDASQKGNKLYFDRIFDDILMMEGVTTHYLPVRGGNGYYQERGIDVWLALDAFEQAYFKHFDILVLIASDGDYVPLVRKLNSLGTRVMVLSWDFEYTDDYGQLRVTKTSQALMKEASYPILMHQLINDEDNQDDDLINALFVPRTPRTGDQDYESWEGEGDDEERQPIDDEEYKVSSVLSLKNGYGFIKYPPNNLFFHYQSMEDGDFAELQPGDRVRFRLDRNQQGQEIAVDVSHAEGVESDYDAE